MTPTKAFLAVIVAHMSDHPNDWRVKHSSMSRYDEIANEAMGVSISRSYESVDAVRVNGAGINIPFGWGGKLRRAVDICLAKQAIAKFKAQAGEARRAETTGSVHEHAVAKPCAQ